MDEVDRRKLEIHVERRGDYRCDFDEFLNEWAQAVSELLEKYDGGKD